MFHKNILILVFLLNLNIALSYNGCDNITSAESNETCFGVTIPNSNEYPDYCCYYEPVDDTNANKFCRTVPYSTFYDEETYENINDHLYKVSCQSNGEKKTYLEQCGDVSKGSNVDFEDCKEHSTLLNSCCLAKGNSDIKKGCYWLGTKYEGEINWAGVDMECNLTYIKYSLFYLIFIFSIIF